MSTATKPLRELIEELPPDLHDDVRDFVEFLLTKRERQAGRPLKQDWAGALREHREQLTSLELERQASKWRGE
jgi:hypothetical protein